MGWQGIVRRFPVLGIRDFRLLLADRLLAPGAFQFSLVGVAFAVLDLTRSTADLSYVLAAQLAPSLVFLLVGGVIADRVAPQRVIAAANLMIAGGEATFGALILAGRPALWQMIALETLTGSGMALFYPASQALTPRLVPPELLQEASAISRLAMNTALMGGAAVAGVVVAAAGPGWALLICGTGMTGTVPLMLALRVAAAERAGRGSPLKDLREGWAEVVSRTWLWVIIVQFTVVLAMWYGSFQVLGPVIAHRYLGGPAAWGAITASDSVGLMLGGIVSLRFSPRRPMLFVAAIGGACAVSPLSLALRLPVAAVCAAAVALGVAVEMMAVQWTVALARHIPADRLARVSSFDALGSMMATPVGALVAGPVAAAVGVFRAEYGAAALTVAASALAFIPRDVRALGQAGPDGAGGAEPAPAASTAS